jgi:hypothetical protein
MVQLDVGDGRGDQQREMPDAGHGLGTVEGVKPNRGLHPLVVRCCFRCRRRRHNLSAQSLDDTPRHDGPATSKHDMERLVALVVVGLKVRVAIDGLQCPLRILKLHLCIFLLLGVQLLLALPLARRRAIMALLLHLFAELFCELLYLPALRRGVAHGVVHRTLRVAVVAIGWLTGAFVTSRPTTAPTRRCSCGRGRSDQWLVATSLLVAVVVAAAAALGPNAGLALPLCLLGSWGVPGAALRRLGALVHQAEERGHILDIVGGKLLQHLLIPYSLVKCNHYRIIEDMRNDIVNLREPLDEGAQGFPRVLLDRVEVC